MHHQARRSRQSLLHRRLFRRQLGHLLTPLRPLLSITTATAHPAFPSTILHYHLLTSPQLNDLAHHYHQSSPKAESWGYPLSIADRWAISTTNQNDQPHPNNPINQCYSNSTQQHLNPQSSYPQSPKFTRTPATSIDTVCAAIMGLNPPQPITGKAPIADRRRRFGRFIGMQGCESPDLDGAEAAREAERAMERWVESEVGRRVERERERERVGKGAW